MQLGKLLHFYKGLFEAFAATHNTHVNDSISLKSNKANFEKDIEKSVIMLNNY